MCSRSNSEACSTCSCVRGHGVAASWNGVAEDDVDRHALAPAASCCSAAGLTGAENAPPARPGAPDTSARYAAPRWKRSRSPAPREPSGKMPTTFPSRSTRRQRFTAQRVGVEPVQRDLPGAEQEPPQKPLNISILVSACTGRGREDRQQRAVGDPDVVGGEDHRARASAASSPSRRAPGSGAGSTGGAQRPQRVAAGSARGADRALAEVARRSRSRALRPPRPGRPPGRSPRRGCTPWCRCAPRRRP